MTSGRIVVTDGCFVMGESWEERLTGEWMVVLMFAFEETDASSDWSRQLESQDWT